VCVLHEGAITRGVAVAVACLLLLTLQLKCAAEATPLLADLSTGPVRSRRACCIGDNLAENGPSRWTPAVTIASDICNLGAPTSTVGAARRSAAVALAAVALAVVIAVVDERQDVGVAELSVDSSEL
jgi:hypothetical protein